MMRKGLVYVNDEGTDLESKFLRYMIYCISHRKETILTRSSTKTGRLMKSEIEDATCWIVSARMISPSCNIRTKHLLHLVVAVNLTG